MTLAPLSASLGPLGRQRGALFNPTKIAGGVLWIGSDRPPALVAYVAAVVARGATGLWLLDEASGAPADASGAGHPLTLNGAPTYRQVGPSEELPYAVSGWSAANFFSTNDAVFRRTGAASVGFWLRTSTPAAGMAPIAKDNTAVSTDRCWEFVTGAVTASRMTFYTFNGGSNFPLTASINVPTNTWAFYVGTYHPTNGMALFINGVSNATRAAGAAINAGTTPVTVGKRDISGAEAAWVGQLGGVFYAPSALTAADVQAIYESGLRMLAAMPNAFGGGATAAQANLARKQRLAAGTVVGHAGAGLDLASLTVPSNGHTLVLAGTPVTPTSPERFLTLVGGANRRILQQASSQIILNHTSGSSDMHMSGVPVPAVEAVMVGKSASDGSTVVWSDRTKSYRRYGQLGVPPTPASMTSGVLDNYTDYLSGFTGTWREQLIFDTALSDATIKRLIGWLAAKRGRVLTPATHVVVFDGDSLTVGFPAGPAYTDQVLVGLGWIFEAYNIGIPGQKISEIVVNSPAKVDPLYDAGMTNILVVWAGTNDLATGATAAAAYANLVAYCQARRAVGFKVVVATMLPRTYTGDAVGTETQRGSFNTSIRNGWATFADRLADLAADTTIGDAGDQNNVTYYDADKAHMTTAGYAIVAGIVKAAVLAL